MKPNLIFFCVLPYPYPMPVDELCTLQIPTAIDPAVLFMWTLNDEFLPDKFKILDAWGFRGCGESVMWTTDKIEKIGFPMERHGEMGILYQPKGQCLIGLRGNPRRPKNPLDDIIEPTKAKAIINLAMMIENRFPKTLKLTMFAAPQRPGWSRWKWEQERDNR